MSAFHVCVSSLFHALPLAGLIEPYSTLVAVMLLLGTADAVIRSPLSHAAESSADGQKERWRNDLGEGCRMGQPGDDRGCFGSLQAGTYDRRGTWSCRYFSLSQYGPATSGNARGAVVHGLYHRRTKAHSKTLPWPWLSHFGTPGVVPVLKTAVFWCLIGQPHGRDAL